MLNISLITIGDEILIGQIVNTNAAWISAECTKLGCKVLAHTVVGDNKDALISELVCLSDVSDVMILTGGLGPTHDDKTKGVLTAYFGDKLVLHNETLEYLEVFFRERGYEISELNRQQAMLPSKCTPLPNRVGTAPGMLFEYNDKLVISLPGVPAEMKYIMKDSVLPLLKKVLTDSNTDVTLYKTIQTAGIPESVLANKIGDPEDFLSGATLAFLPSYFGVRLRIGVTADNFAIAEQKIDGIFQTIKSKVAEYIISENGEPVAETVAKLLIEKQKTIAVAESCTGGMLGAALTDIPGSSSYFLGGVIAYSNESKISIVGVNPQTINKYGAVSRETALELAQGVKSKFKSNIGIAITGVAGPGGGTPEKPVGTICFGLATESRAESWKYFLGSQRDVNRERAVGTALRIIYEAILKNS